MAVHFRRKRKQDEEESVFVSMTDMTVSFLFIMLIMLAFFASQFNEDDVVPKKEHTKILKENEVLKKENERLKKLLSKDLALANYLAGISDQKLSLMMRIKTHIEEKTGLRVEIDPINGIIRFSGDDLFGSGQWRVSPGSTADQVAKAIGNVFDELLPCYSLGENSKFSEQCNNSYAVLEAIQIEGHTDEQAISSNLKDRERMEDNNDLSARRSAEMLRAMTKRHLPHLLQFWNLKEQPVLSFSGYGYMRPLVPNKDSKSRAKNRRIDLRFIMATPNTSDEIDAIKKSLRTGHPELMDRATP
jgi:flagellar motor protein MotB